MEKESLSDPISPTYVHVHVRLKQDTGLEEPAIKTAMLDRSDNIDTFTKNYIMIITA